MNTTELESMAQIIAQLVEDSSPTKLLILTKSTGGLATYNRNFLTALPDDYNAAVICLSDNALPYAKGLDTLNEQLEGIERVTPYALPMNRYAIGVGDLWYSVTGRVGRLSNTGYAQQTGCM